MARTEEQGPDRVGAFLAIDAHDLRAFAQRKENRVLGLGRKTRQRVGGKLPEALAIGGCRAERHKA